MEAESSVNLLSVAHFHRKILKNFAFLWLGGILADILTSGLKLAGFGILNYLVSGIFILILLDMTYQVYYLADALQYDWPIAWFFGMLTFSPFNIFILLYLNYKAVSALREIGVNVGLMGVSVSSVQQELRKNEGRIERVESRT